ncbi:MAG: hypothetical protein HY719_16730 [Planctomycetes bacterium]|nr:hypothetical protein [Planctomycetota bacterium]
MPVTVQCWFCRTECDASARYCGYCGKKVVRTQPVGVVEERRRATKNRNDQAIRDAAAAGGAPNAGSGASASAPTVGAATVTAATPAAASQRSGQDTPARDARAAKNCRKCLRPLPAGVFYCVHCGTRVSENPALGLNVTEVDLSPGAAETSGAAGGFPSPGDASGSPRPGMAAAIARRGKTSAPASASPPPPGPTGGGGPRWLGYYAAAATVALVIALALLVRGVVAPDAGMGEPGRRAGSNNASTGALPLSSGVLGRGPGADVSPAAPAPAVAAPAERDSREAARRALAQARSALRGIEEEVGQPGSDPRLARLTRRIESLAAHLAAARRGLSPPPGSEAGAAPTVDEIAAAERDLEQVRNAAQAIRNAAERVSADAADSERWLAGAGPGPAPR